MIEMGPPPEGVTVISAEPLREGSAWLVAVSATGFDEGTVEGAR